MANNAAAAYRMGGRDILVLNEYFADGTTLTFDTGRDYAGEYVYIRLYRNLASISLPLQFLYLSESYQTNWTHRSLLLLTTTLQAIDTSIPTNWQIRALSGGGFAIQNSSGSDYYMIAFISELRHTDAE